MRIELLTISAGPAGVRQPGVHEMPEPEAKALIKGGYARPAPGPIRNIVESMMRGPSRSIETRDAAAEEKSERTSPPATTPDSTSSAGSSSRRGRSMKLGSGE